MATTAEIQTAFKAIYRTDLNATVAASIAGSGISLDAYIASQLPQVASTTQAAVAIASFVTGTAPTSDKLDALKVAADAQVASYTALGVGNPSLGAYEAFGRSFATDTTTTAGFATKYGALSTADFIGVVYGQVYGTTPSAGAAANLTAQITYFTNLFTANGVANAALAAKGAVLGQIVGYAFVSSASSTSLLDNQVQSLLTSAAKGDTSVYAKALPVALDPGQVGVTITLAGTATDAVGPTAADPAFKTTGFNDTINGTFLLGAKIDGAAGDDVANLSVTGILTPAAGAIANLETINVATLGGAAAGFNLTNITGYKTVGFTDGAAASPGSFTNLAAGTALFLTDTTPATASNNATFALKTDTAADAATLTLNGYNGATATVTGYETLNVVVTGNDATANGGVTLADAGLKALTVAATKNVALTLDSTVLESVVATGAGSVALGTISNTTKTVDGSGLTGTTGLSFTIAAGNSLESVKASGGIDNFTITTTGKALAVDLGAGADTLVYTQTNGAASSVFGEVNGGAGADVITLSNTGSTTAAFSTQKVTLGAGADTLTIADNATNVVTTLVYSGTDSTLTFKDAITGFQAAGNAVPATNAADKIDLSAYALGAATVSYTAVALPVADSVGLFTGAGTNVIAYAQGGTTLLIDTNKDGSFTIGTDLAIQLVGVTNTNVTAANFIV